MVAARTLPVAEAVAHAIACGYFRPYTNTDVVGTEIGTGEERDCPLRGYLRSTAIMAITRRRPL